MFLEYFLVEEKIGGLLVELWQEKSYAFTTPA